MTTMITAFTDESEGCQKALYAFLAEKERRSGSMRTVESYSRMLQEFFGRLGKPPDLVTAQDLFAYAHGIGRSGKEPSAITIGARMSCISAFYRFLLRMEIVASNPCDKLERPRTEPSPLRGLSADEIRRLLNVIPDSTVGLRDRAIITTLVLTGRRRSEVINLMVGDLQIDGDTVFYTYKGKGGKRGRRELLHPAYVAITASLTASGKKL